MNDGTKALGQPEHRAVMTPAEVVAQSEIAQKLRDVGATDADLAVLQFSKFRPNEQSISMWAVWAPRLLPEQEERVGRLLRQHNDLCKAYCAYRWLILDDPPSSQNKEAAWNYVTYVLAIPIYETGLKARQNQQKRAQQPRAAVGDGGERLHQIIEALLSKPEFCEMRAKELWPHLRAALDDHSLAPREVAGSGDIRNAAYTYDFRDRRRRISFGGFANIVSKLRKKTS